MKKKAFDLWLLAKYPLIEPEKIPPNPIKVTAIIYSIKACNGVKIYAFPKANCNIPHKNPDKAPPLTPHRKHIIKIGTIENEMLTPIAIFIEGKRSIKKANAAKIAISILACKGNALFTFLTPVFESFISNKRFTQE